MNIKKFDKRLSKINRLWDSIKEDGEVSSIEKDLLLSYMREAYEHIKETADVTTTSSKRYAEPEHHVPPQASNKVNVLEQIASEEVTPVFEAPRATAATPDEPTATSSATELPSIANEIVVDVDPALEQIFQNADVSELSDRLSMSSIKDMNRAMGINERIFTVKELFGGDTEVFNNVLAAINDCKSYEEAKTYLLTGIATEQDWANTEKLKKAEHFVKLVKRRFV